MALYQTNSDITHIDEKGKLALSSLRDIIQNSSENSTKLYRNLDIFLFSARHLKSIIASIDYQEQESFKQTILSDMFEKIYDNMKKENRERSLLRFALVSLLSDKFDLFTPNIFSHIFYDIHNGININAQLLKEVVVDKIAQKKTLDEPDMIDESQKELLNAFLEENQNKKFIQIFLYSLLNMASSRNIEREKSAKFISFTTYIATEENPKITYKDGIDKIQIEHCFMAMVLFLIESNINRFFFLIEEFFDTEEEITIKEFIQEQYSYGCKESSKEVKIVEYMVTKTSLRKTNSRFLIELLRVGLFYQLISKESSINDIIVVSFKRIMDGEIDTKELCQNSITFKFLSLFFRGHGKKDCNINLQSFLEESQLLLNE
jgi:hypothetical protein